MKEHLAYLLVLGIIPLLMSCLASRPLGSVPPSGSQGLGSFSVSSQVFSAQSFTPTVCTAGDRQLFLGSDLSSPNSSLVLRLVVDPLEGPAVRLFSSQTPFDKSIVFRRSDCRVFHFSLDSTGWRVNDINDYRLTLQLECDRQGESIVGSASSSHCH